MTPRQEALFYYFTLSVEARKWSYLVKSFTNQETKQALNQMHIAEDRLIKVIRRQMDAQWLEELENQAEVFSMILKKIKELDTPEKKQELFNLLAAYANNELIIRNE